MRIRTIDIETYEKQDDKLVPILNAREFTLGGLKKDTGGYYEFESKKEMANYIIEDILKGEKLGEQTFYYGHSMAYDFYGTFADYLDNGEIININDEYEIRCFCLYPFISYFVRKDTGKTIGYFLDSMAYFRCALKEVGDMLNFPKLEMPEEIKSINELRVYLKRDCEIVLKGMLRIKSIINKLGFYPKKYLTAGHTSINCFLNYARKNNLAYVFSSKGITYKGKYMDETRRAFRGGRCECLQKGYFEKVIKLDCNSMYPYIMTQMRFPNLKSEFKVEGERALYYLDYLGVMKCKIKAPEEGQLRYAYLPIRHRGYVHYPFVI